MAAARMRKDSRVRVRRVGSAVALSGEPGAIVLGASALMFLSAITFVIALSGPWLLMATFVPVSVLVAVWLLMRLDARAFFDTDGVSIEFGFRRYDFRWEELECIGINPKAAQVRVQARGKAVYSLLIPEYWQLSPTPATRASSTEAHDRVSRLAEPHGITVFYNYDWTVQDIEGRTVVKGQRRSLTPCAKAVLIGGSSIAVVVAVVRIIGAIG